MTTTFSVNSRTYTTPGVPVVVICIDGSEPEYHLEAIKAGRMPWLAGVLESGRGTSWEAHCAMPALTNPNNVSIATGRPPAVHGISGNYILDTDTGDEVLMNDKLFLRAPTLFAAANEAGLDVVVVTAKDKLRRLLGAGLVEDGPALDGSGEFVAPSRRGICLSAEKADEATIEENGIDEVLALVGKPRPSVYSADLSVFALAAGVEILRTRGADLMYLSLSDYIQHKHAPGTEAANDLYAQIDHYAAQLDALGAVVVLTADHGMSAKTGPDGTANVLFVEDEVRAILGSTAAEPGSDGLRVILPITDPYTVHHGALGSFASVYLPDGANLDTTIEALRALDGVQAAYGRAEAASTFSLPPDRIGDIVVLGEAGTAVGRYAAWHDLTGLADAPLRSHGALGELQIPFLVNRALPQPEQLDEPWGRPAYIHNYDAFWAATTLVTGQTLATTSPS
ncbi:phosphonoacetate hydrolase [Kribbella sp. NPDC048928]|uniref:phosphonoacetate hydrolase n=1 Tax=Kribbella sp. NPDC048928 TaxID=3364111 RepID=UPI00371E86AC